MACTKPVACVRIVGKMIRVLFFMLVHISHFHIRDFLHDSSQRHLDKQIFGDEEREVID